MKSVFKIFEFFSVFHKKIEKKINKKKLVIEIKFKKVVEAVHILCNAKNGLPSCN